MLKYNSCTVEGSSIVSITSGSSPCSISFILWSGLIPVFYNSLKTDLKWFTYIHSLHVRRALSHLCSFHFFYGCIDLFIANCKIIIGISLICLICTPKSRNILIKLKLYLSIEIIHLIHYPYPFYSCLIRFYKVQKSYYKLTAVLS
jgi:hypothetical protein